MLDDIYTEGVGLAAAGSVFRAEPDQLIGEVHRPTRRELYNCEYRRNGTATCSFLDAPGERSGRVPLGGGLRLCIGELADLLHPKASASVCPDNMSTQSVGAPSMRPSPPTRRGVCCTAPNSVTPPHSKVAHISRSRSACSRDNVSVAASKATLPRARRSPPERSGAMRPRQTIAPTKSMT